MKARAIDTLKFSRDLTKAGLDKKVAEGLAEAINEAQCDSQEDLATKQDILGVKQDITLVKKDISMLENKMEQEFKLIRSEIKTSMYMTIISLGAIISLIEKFFK